MGFFMRWVERHKFVKKVKTVGEMTKFVILRVTGETPTALTVSTKRVFPNISHVFRSMFRLRTIYTLDLCTVKGVP